MHVLFIPKWFPGRHDPQLGDFIRKQGLAVATRARTSVLVLVGVRDDALVGTEVREEAGLWELHCYYRLQDGPSSPASRMRNAWAYLRAGLQGWERIVRERGRPDLVHAHILVRPVALARLLQRRFRVPYLVSEQSSVFLDGSWEKRSAMEQRMARRLMRHAAMVTAVSPWLGDALVTQGLCTKYEVVPNVIPGLDRPLPPAGRPGHFLVVADLVDRTKNVSGVLRALRAARLERPDLRLDIIGDGPDRAALEALCQELSLGGSVHFLGRLANSAVLDHMAGCGAVVVNSNVETFSVVTGESLALGKPVIATRCGGPVAFVTAENGILVEPRDDNALAAAMLDLTRGADRFHPDLVRRSVDRRFSPQAVAGGFISLYEQVLHHG
ncbi:MAG: glycosyltransferase [Flavobacteriales bacterium]|nr:glycosyltransferase [Flavobacteriales bacterium]